MVPRLRKPTPKRVKDLHAVDYPLPRGIQETGLPLALARNPNAVAQPRLGHKGKLLLPLEAVDLPDLRRDLPEMVRVVELIRQTPGITNAEIQRELGVPKSRVERLTYLTSLLMPQDYGLRVMQYGHARPTGSVAEIAARDRRIFGALRSGRNPLTLRPPIPGLTSHRLSKILEYHRKRRALPAGTKRIGGRRRVENQRTQVEQRQLIQAAIAFYLDPKTAGHSLTAYLRGLRFVVTPRAVGSLRTVIRHHLTRTLKRAKRDKRATKPLDELEANVGVLAGRWGISPTQIFDLARALGVLASDEARPKHLGRWGEKDK